MDYKYIAKSYTGLHKQEQEKKLNIIKSYIKKHNIQINNKTILDIGSGTGISLLNKETIGIEPEINMIKQKKYKAITANSEHLPIKSNSIDIITCITAFHNFKNPEKALNEFKRILKPRCLLIITILKRSKNCKNLLKLIKSNFKTIAINEEKDTILISNKLA